MTLFASISPMWLATRGAGVVAFLLLTTTMALGVAGVLRLQARGWPRFALDAIHRSAALLALVFVGVHVATTVLDGYVDVRWIDAVVPFASGYRTFFVGLGAVAFDILLALAISGILRQRIGHRTWRAIHWAAYACWPIALVHTIGTGSDSGSVWLLAVIALCCATVAAAVVARLGVLRGDPSPPAPPAAGRTTSTGRTRARAVAR
ncbi:ferric reductase-like transmembrane domain-containing protein [Conexibacter sp. JD483]|uniref:ferric reductase-like transmembrane domain-containing protein n=1 Tax=unclassified Conexibacter TaxID=2627773 RepID=UPI00271E4D25|nr:MULTISPECIES: ferric reductase-like transmembrane domain-containing protein [unclassified Conexibacter]MDO8188412.1 ferric reductase-like transmembrane domain-containing protein [Conexibacter sp. CPCC 205706]MDO8198199.1 ferric reductase-like transmembrane domain-containing protein [Conexibacter sp. CPCC 205762]MDR9370665.1 ferric reductase-like transmembrane domain-containing protein [Conexibacter sp. JD483]